MRLRIWVLCPWCPAVGYVRTQEPVQAVKLLEANLQALSSLQLLLRQSGLSQCGWNR